MVDDVAIKKQMRYGVSTKTMQGYVDFGVVSPDSDGSSETTEAIVVMAVGVLGR